MNFDTLLIKPIIGLNEFLVRSPEDAIESHPLGLRHNHPMFDVLLRDLSKNYDGNSSNSIGSQLLAQAVKEECEVSKHLCINYHTFIYRCEELNNMFNSFEFRRKLLRYKTICHQI